MKSRYKDFVNKQQRDIYNRMADEMQRSFAVIYEKLLLYTFHTQFGFGEKRLKQMFEAVAAQMNTIQTDPVFWDRVDRDVIDNMHFDYPRSDCELLEKAFYKPPQVSAEEKRLAVADMRKMREFLSQNTED